MSATPEFVLRANDRLVFLGDSITEQQLYTNYVESYLASRYPELNLTFFNAGWGGDTAPGGAARLDRDVLRLKPTVVTICYGMNDGGYLPPSAAIRATFVNGLRELVARLTAAGVRVVLLTPGMVDEAINPNLAAVNYNHGGLRILVDEVLTLAATAQLPVADLHRLMNDVNARARAAEPKFCMIPDGVHPDPAGHLVMAFGLLQALGVPPRRERVTVNLGAKQVTASAGVAAARLRPTAHGCTLELKLDRLPFFVEAAARKVLPYLPFQETYNELKLVVGDLPAERGYLRSATLRGAVLTRAEFAAGVNLFSQWALGVVQQADVVHRYTLEKDQIYFKIWRQLALLGPDYHARTHAAAVRFSPALDRSRAKLLTRQARQCRLTLVATDVPGEPLANDDFISQWHLAGPFPKPYATDYLGGEAAFTAAGPRADFAWMAAELDLANLGNCLCQFFGARTDCFAYALTVIESPVAQEATLLLGSDDGFAVWLNGAALAANLDVNRPLTRDQERLPVRLRAGGNVLLLKITQGAGEWGFSARFAGLTKPVVARRPPGRDEAVGGPPPAAGAPALPPATTAG